VGRQHFDPVLNQCVEHLFKSFWNNSGGWERFRVSQKSYWPLCYSLTGQWVRVIRMVIQSKDKIVDFVGVSRP
jgi:hypothetical protein